MATEALPRPQRESAVLIDAATRLSAVTSRNPGRGETVSVPGAPEVPGMRLPERIMIERALLQMYPRLQRHDLFPWKLLHGPLISDFWVRQTPQHLRRIVVIGCGDGVLCNVLSLLFPRIEIIGIDRNAEKIAAARRTVGHRNNLKFIAGNAAVMLDIPCDRIIYEHCLAELQSDFAFKKLVVKTLPWLVSEGDFIVTESPLKMLFKPHLLRSLLPELRRKKSLEACLRGLLSEVGYPNPLAFSCKQLPGVSSEVIYRFSQALTLSAMLGGATEATPAVSEWHDTGDQSVHSVLGFLFSDQKADFSHELT